MSRFQQEYLQPGSKVYFIGIKGVAMTALAVICKKIGLSVIGSDVAEEFITDKILEHEGISYHSDFDAEHISDFKPDLVIVGQSWTENNIELKKAFKMKLAVLIDSDLRGQFSRLKETIAVTGVHGKTTLTALLAYIYSQAGADPSYLIGTAHIPQLGISGQWGSGNQFIVEGDEYAKSKNDKTPKFLDLDPAVSIITSIEWEHVDIFKNVEALEECFSELIEKTKGMVLACTDYLSVEKIITPHRNKVVTYGTSNTSDWQMYDYRQHEDKSIFKIKQEGKHFAEIEMKLFGQHNALNALAALVVAFKSGIELSVIQKAIADFSGLERRFQISEKGDIIWIDDYGHHPTEILVTLQAIRTKYPDKKVWCVFQPHMASRTKALLDQFATCFTPADNVLIPNIFASAREKSGGVDSEVLAREVSKYHPHVLYTGTLDQTLQTLRDNARPGDVIVTMGAGDVYKIKDNF